MTQAAFGGETFSKPVKLWLEWEGGRVALGQVGAGFVIAAEPCHVPPCKVTVVAAVGDEVFRHRYHLVDGLLEGDNPRSAIVSCEASMLPF